MSQERPDSGSRPALLIGVLVAVLVLVLGAGGCASKQSSDTHPGTTASSGSSPSPAASPTAPMPGTAAELAAFYDQKLDWSSCGNDQCTRLKVPLDYAHPDGKTIELAVLKVPAQDQKAKVGDLVVNPGGPGASGVQYAQASSFVFGSVLPRFFDIVGFDPRGVGSSDPIQCVGTKRLDALVGSDPDPDTLAERKHMDGLIRTMGEGCLEHSGNLTRHISTVEAAKDIDILRAALGQPKLDYFGASYGTLLGATYANLFPHHVGRMVLDGAIDPALSNAQLSLAQAHGFETALRAYVKDCVDRGGCFLGNSVDAGTHRIRTLLDQIEARPLPTNTSRELTAGTAMVGVWLPLYVKEYWPMLTDALKQAMDGSGSKLLKLSDMYSSRGPKAYRDNSLEALYAVNCLDHDDYIPTAQVPAHFPKFLKASPTFGKAFAFSLSTCSVWPVKSHQATHALHAKGAPPIVVIGTTRDPATPLAWAKALASELASGVLVTRDGDGHTGFNQGNACVDHAVENYLTKHVVPKDGLAC